MDSVSPTLRRSRPGREVGTDGHDVSCTTEGTGAAESEMLRGGGARGRGAIRSEESRRGSGKGRWMRATLKGQRGESDAFEDKERKEVSQNKSLIIRFQAHKQSRCTN